MADFIFAIAELILIISYLFVDILWLRIISIIGLSGYVVAGFVAGYNAQGMKAIIFLNSVAVLANMVQIYFIIKNRTPFPLPDKLKEIYSNNFHMMSTKEFYNLYQKGTVAHIAPGKLLAKQDEPILELIMITKGSVNIIKNGSIIAVLKKGFFIGEMSFLQNSTATATVEVNCDDFECIMWNKSSIKDLAVKDHDFYLKIQEAIAFNLVKKLDIQNK